MGPFEWLIAVLVLGVIIIVGFQKQIASLFGRIKSIGFFQFVQPQETTVPTLSKMTADDLTRGIDSALIREIEDQFKKTTEGMQDSEKIKALSRLFAASLWGYTAMNIYRLIFGSQIAALEFLNTRGQVPRDTLKPFYAAATNQHPDFYRNYSYDQWVGFLTDQFLILNRGGEIGITIRGQEFLTQLVRDNLSKAKAG